MGVTPSPRRLLRVEELEPRQVLAGVQPTAVEQLFLEQLNDIRANPAAYGANIGVNLSAVAPSQPLAFNPLLIQAAHQHSLDLSNRGYFAHVTPEGLDPGDRLSAVGFPWTGYGESLAGGTVYWTPADALKALILDAGFADLGHRKHLLAIDSIFRSQKQVGIGIVQHGAGPLRNYYTIDTASTADTRPFITGVVINDLDGDGKYDVGEGIGGVTLTVTASGSTTVVASATSYGSGGYSLRVRPGTYTVKASGGGLSAPISRTVTVGANNVRLTFKASNDAYIQKLYRRVLGHTAASGDVQFWLQVLSQSGPHTVVDAIERSAEARTRLVKGWYANYLGRSPRNGEEQFWVSQLLAGVTEEEVLAGLLGTPEYLVRTGVLLGAPASETTFVKALYRQLLGRTATSGEIGFWKNALMTVSRQDVAEAFLTSDSFRSLQVRSYYTNLLHRTPQAGEVVAWVDSDFDLASVRIVFESTTEYMVNR